MTFSEIYVVQRTNRRISSMRYTALQNDQITAVLMVLISRPTVVARSSTLIECHDDVLSLVSNVCWRRSVHLLRSFLFFFFCKTSFNSTITHFATNTNENPTRKTYLSLGRNVTTLNFERCCCCKVGQLETPLQQSLNRSMSSRECLTFESVAGCNSPGNTQPSGRVSGDSSWKFN